MMITNKITTLLKITKFTETICNMEEENGRQNVVYSELFQKQWPKNSFHFMQVFIETNERSYLNS